MTQECLAELVGIHWQTLGRIERGEFPFATTTFAKLTQYLQVSPNRLLDGLDPPDSKRVARITKAMARKRRPRKLTPRPSAG
jgi:DNA-binding XRE family transcriptional regulator